jgi:anti-anti-sigma regulatory factor
MPLTYFINRKKVTCVISLTGSLTEADLPIVQKCGEEVDAEPAKYTILNLSGLTEIDPSMAGAFTSFQQSLRAKGSQLFLCGVIPKLLEALKKDGLVRDAEVQFELLVVLQSIMKAEGG